MYQDLIDVISWVGDADEPNPLMDEFVAAAAALAVTSAGATEDFHHRDEDCFSTADQLPPQTQRPV